MLKIYNERKIKVYTTPETTSIVKVFLIDRNSM